MYDVWILEFIFVRKNAIIARERSLISNAFTVGRGYADWRSHEFHYESPYEIIDPPPFPNKNEIWFINLRFN